MADTSKGKKWETKFKEDWTKTFPNTFIYRLPDQQSGYYGGSSNPCDFLALPNNHLLMLEIKAHKGNTFPFSAFPQYEKLIKYKDLPNIRAGVIVWFEEHDLVVWTPIEECEKMINDNKKSINIKMLNEDTYKVVEIPSIKQRVFMKCDYSMFKDI